MDIVERLRFDAARCEVQFSKGVAGNIEEAADEIERLREDLALRNQTACDRLEALKKLEPEVERLRRGLNIIVQAGTVYGGAWCIAQALGHLHDLDFDTYPETGKPLEPSDMGADEQQTPPATDDRGGDRRQEGGRSRSPAR